MAATLTAAPSAPAICISSVEYRGVSLEGTGVSFASTRAAGAWRIGRGTIPDCADTGGPAGPGTPITVFALPGISPRLAVATRAGDGQVWVYGHRTRCRLRLYRAGRVTPTRYLDCLRWYSRRL